MTEDDELHLCPHHKITCPSWNSNADECIEEFYALIFVNKQAVWEKRCQEIRDRLLEEPD